MVAAVAAPRARAAPRAGALRRRRRAAARARPCALQGAAPRRALLAASCGAWLAGRPWAGAARAVEAEEAALKEQVEALSAQVADLKAKLKVSRFASFAAAGPFEVGTYSVEHTSDDLSPKCVGSECLVKLTTYYPKGWQSLRKGGSERAPVAVLSAGFGLTAASYQSYARHLASYGWVCVCYDVNNTAMTKVLTDDLIVAHLSEVLDYVASSRPLKDHVSVGPGEVFLVGHSRGGKLSVLEAAQDERVGCVALLDPVDNTVYAPLAPGFPSAAQQLREGLPARRARGDLPIALVGAAKGEDCAPKDANYDAFFEAARLGEVGPLFEVVIPKVGHLQFLDGDATQKNFCFASEETGDADVHTVARGVLVAWGLKHLRGSDHTNGLVVDGEVVGDRIDMDKVVEGLEAATGTELQVRRG